ncbi:MAG TPA: hypothetical protein VH044_17910 [Polyangiaceae bacterium]|jgi:Spy/CpxP family protein refolding chaperone|nr:hypothetical protein [Polyangiaceae bacterium]
MKRIHSIGLSILLAATACKGKGDAAAASDAEPAASSSAAAEATSAEPSAVASASAAVPPPARHRGLVGLFFKAALETDLSDDAKTGLDKIEEPVRGDSVPRHEMAAVHADLIASIKAGKVDTAKIQTDEAGIVKAFAEHEADEATALAQLHDALSPPQRKAVTDAVRAAEAAHDRPPPSADAGSPDFVGRRLEKMKAQLVLDEDQEKQVRAVLSRDMPSPATMQAHYEAGKKQFEALLTAFEKDTFDPKKVDLSSTPGRKPTDPIDRQVKYVGQLLPILTAGQRDRFALLIEHPRGDRGRADITEPPELGGRW